MATTTTSDAAGQRETAIQTVALDCLRRLAEGESFRDESIERANPELMPELSAELAELRRIHAAAKMAEQVFGQPMQAPMEQSAAMLRVRCPECHTPSEIVADNDLANVTCGSCGESFSLVGRDDEVTGTTLLTTIGHFELLEQIGVGGFGTVWKARDKELDRLVAIKFPRRGQLGPDEAEKFLREARAAAQLRHPNIVSVHEVGRDGDRVYLVSDLIEGVSLAEWLFDQRMSAPEIARLCQKIALALEHAHAAGIIHRDLKPANVLLDHAGEPHLTDFGLARRQTHETTVTVEGEFLGTPAYMSPEQARGESHAADQKSDVYSLGVILYELLTGEIPFRGNPANLLHQIVYDEPRSPRAINRNITRDLETITLKCLQKDPARRYATAQGLADDLGRFSHGEPIHARPVSRAERTWRWCRRNPRMAGLTVTVAALLLVVVTVTTYSSVRSIAAAREARWQQYLSDMHVAMQAWEDGDLGRALEALERHRPARGEEDLRGFEWYYLWPHVREALAVPGFKLDSQVRALRVSPDGKFCATGDENGGLTLWNLADLRRVRVLEGTRFRTGAIDFTTDGRLIATGSSVPPIACIWDVKSGRLVHKLEGHRDNVLSVAFSPHENLLATGSSDYTSKVWDVATGIEKCTLTGHTDKVSFVAWRDNNTVITGSWDQTIREWNASDGSQSRIVAQLPLPVADTTYALSPNRTLMAAGSSDGSIRLIDARTGAVQGPLVGHRDRVRALTFSADGTMLASASADRRALLWDVSTRKPRATIKAHSSSLVCLALTPDGARLLTGSQDGWVKLSSLQAVAAEDPVCRGHEDFIFGIAFDHQGERLVTTSNDGSVRVWNVATGTIENVLTEHASSMSGVAASPRDSIVVATSRDGTVSAWNLDNKARLWTSPTHANLASTVDISPEGDVVASAGGDNVVRLFHAGDGSPAGTFASNDESTFAVKFSCDGELLAFGGHKGSLSLVNWKTGEPVHTLVGHRGTITAVAFSRDGKTVATGGIDGLAILWDLVSGRRLHTLPHGESINSVAFSPDSKILAIAKCDGRIHLWDVATGAERTQLNGHTGWVESVVFSPDGTILATAGDDRTIRLWRADSPD